MSNITTHLGNNFNWIAYKNGDNQFVVTFTDDDDPFDITDHVFTVNIRKYGSSTNELQLTEGSGVTNGGASGILTVDLTQTQASTTLPGDYYFYEVIYEVDSKTYALIQGGLTLSRETNPGSTITSLTAEVNIGGVSVDASITLIGAIGNANIDGGSASTVYLSDQNLDGGTA